MGDANSRLNLLKPNAATRGWLTVCSTDLKVILPFEVGHTGIELCELSNRLRELGGETRVVMEATRNPRLAAEGPNQIIL